MTELSILYDQPTEPLLGPTPDGVDYSACLCARCAGYMKTCCQSSEIYTTAGDVARIEAATGRADFTEYRHAGDPVYLDQDDDPTWRDHVFRGDGTRQVLRKQANGDCLFLGERGCRLDMEVRPLICRLYPFDYTEAGLRTRLARGCPVELLRPGMTLLDELDMGDADARRWHAMLYREVRAEPHRDSPEGRTGVLAALGGVATRIDGPADPDFGPTALASAPSTRREAAP